jgi:prepilin-type N-terminal cleavage/methylation domain-containing protein
MKPAPVHATLPSRVAARRRRRHPRGFSLIELGIVIAVIAVLATVVIFGRGFIAAGRITKAVEATDVIRKGASTLSGLAGGTLTPAGGAELTNLQNRNLVPQLVGGAWIVSGDQNNPADNIAITDVRFGQVNNPATNLASNAVGINVRTPTPAMAADIWNATVNDRNRIANGQQIPGAPGPCANGAPAGNNIFICFFL